MIEQYFTSSLEINVALFGRLRRGAGGGGAIVSMPFSMSLMRSSFSVIGLAPPSAIWMATRMACVNAR